MLNPVFHCDSTFLDQRPDGSVDYLSGDRLGQLEAGISITPLTEKQPLFRIETESGAELRLTPETVFALRKTPDGRLVRYLPIDGAYAANPPRLSWHASVDDIDKSDIRRFALVGLIVANGTHSTEPTRPSNILLPNHDIAKDVFAFLEMIAIAKNYGGFGRTRKPSIRSLSNGRVFIKSRTLTNAASWLIEPKTQELLFDPMKLSRQDMWAFAFGVINGALIEGDQRIITHRSILSLRVIARTLELRFGISGRVVEGAFEKEVRATKSGHNVHALILNEATLEAARNVGLLPPKGDMTPRPYSAEKIVKVDAIPARCPAVIVTGARPDYPYPLTVNSFVFDAEFTANAALTDLAAHPMILTDPSDPTTLLADAPVHIARGKMLHDRS